MPTRGSDAPNAMKKGGTSVKVSAFKNDFFYIYAYVFAYVYTCLPSDVPSNNTDSFLSLVPSKP